MPELALGRRLTPWLESSGLPRATAEQYAGRMREPGALHGALGWYRALRHSRGSVHRVAVPTTFVWGRRDDFLGRRAAETTGAFVRGDYRFVEVDEGHWLPELQPDVCATEIVARVAAPPERLPRPHVPLSDRPDSDAPGFLEPAHPGPGSI